MLDEGNMREVVEFCRENGLVLMAEHLARAPQAGLDLVQHEEHVVLAAELAGRGEIAVRRDQDTALTLNGL